MKRDQNDFPPEPGRSFDPTTCEITVSGKLVEQPLTVSERAQSYSERETGMDVFCYWANVEALGLERANQIWNVVFGTPPPFKMITHFLNSVAEFHTAFKYRQPEPSIPDLLDADTNKLRPSLIAEELRETHEAWIINNRVEILDGLCDLQYVLSGAVLAWGFRAFFSPSDAVPLIRTKDIELTFVRMFGMNEQLRIAAESNSAGTALMILKNMQEDLWRLVWSLEFMPVFKQAFDEVHRSNMSKRWDYEELDCMNSTDSYEPSGAKFVVRRHDGKIVKAPTYSPANLAQFV